MPVVNTAGAQMMESQEMRGLLSFLESEFAWKHPYQGTAHTLLLQNIQGSYGASAYANSGSVIQSSGYGKSRTVDEMAKLIATIPMNVRAESDARQGAFPPADSTLSKLFEKISTNEKPVERLHMFFKVLFELVHDMVAGFEGSDVVMSLYEHFSHADKRARFYADLSENLEKNPGGTTYRGAISSFDKLTQRLPPSEERVKMVIYIDEAHTLAPHNVRGPSMYDHILKAAAGMASIGVFFLFISTDSRLDVLPSQGKISNWSRFESSENLVAPFTEMPFDCHPSLVREKIQSGLMLEDVQKFSFAVQFGRPLFWAYYEAFRLQSPHLGYAPSDRDSLLDRRAQIATLAIAQGKFVGNESLSVVPEDAGKLAILDTLLNLEYDPRITHSHQLASTMVASHLRTVYSVSPSRAYMHTGYPSEPVLAEAALTYVNSMKISSPASQGPLPSFYKEIDGRRPGAIVKGECGENVGKMVLLSAYIAAMEKHNLSKPGDSHTPLWGHGCGVVDFLTELTSEKFCPNVLISTPDNVQGGRPLQENFGDSVVRFTHFARAADDSAMTSSMACVAFTRGMAIVGWHSQVGVDVSIPILLDKNKPITEANMSSILVQFKVRSARSTRDQVAIQADKIKYFPPPNSRRDASIDAPKDVQVEYHSRPYISLVMELGLVPSSDGGCTPSKIVHHLDNVGRGSRPSASRTKGPASATRNTPQSSQAVSNVPVSTSPSRSCRTALPLDHIHHRYSLFYYGCSHQVYRCISPGEDTTYRSLLQIPTVFGDRPKRRPMDPVLQMKPFWSAGPNCFSWFNDPYFNPEPQSDENKLDDDQVVIGTSDPVDVDQEGDAMDESA